MSTLTGTTHDRHDGGQAFHKGGQAGEIEYTVRRSKRARRVRVNVRAHTDVEVVLPTHASERAAAAAVRELAPWIERRLSEGHRTLAHIAERGDTVPYLGTPLTLVPQPGRTRAHMNGEKLFVPVGDHRPAVERLYRRLARREIAARLDAAVESIGASHNGLSIRAQSTRWASCSASGAMSFNWRLLLAPEPVLDYVVWHEVCHLDVRDHSPRFWALVERRYPGWREQRDWLRRNGATLVL
ncbi:MAG: SprT family zinc-dependent metalloprotease [Solirubrobacteraceae bacterium]